LREEVFSIEVGSHTGIIEADFGFQIVKVLDRTPTRVKPLQEVRGEISEALYEKKAGPEVEKYTNQLISESYIYVNPDYISEYDLEGLI
jgi:parvulin-like peptidyl-prolyl isomerase